MKKKLTIITAAICFLAVSVFGWHYISLTGISNNQELTNYISQKENIPKDNIEIMATKMEDGFLAAYYKTGTEDHLIILEEDSIFSNRYEYFGSSYSSYDFNTFNFGQSSSWALIIVYGDNADLKATSYEFTNNGNTFTNQNLGNYVLDIYKIEGTSDNSSDGYIYDKNGNKMCML